MKKLTNKKIIVLAILLLGVVIVGAGLFTKKDKGYQEGIVLDSIVLNSYNNEAAQTKDEIMKKPYLLIEFFTLRCPHCKKNIPHLNELNKHNKISVIGYINNNSRKVRSYARENNVEFTLSRASREYTKIFNPVAVPMSFLIDTKTLKVKKSFIGELTSKKVLEYIN